MKLENFPTAVPVVAVALMGDGVTVLMQRRRKSSMHGGLWEFPGGKVEHGEAPEEALAREIREELGICIQVDDLIPVGRAGTADLPIGETSEVEIALFACRSWEGQLQCLDGEEIAWVEVAELSGLDMPPLDYPLAQKLLDYMANEAKKGIAKTG